MNTRESTSAKNAVKQIDKVVYSLSPNITRTLERDTVVIEQPLQINLHWQNQLGEQQTKVFAITMRTLGDDKFLILGLLYSEGVIKNLAQVAQVFPESHENQLQRNNWQVILTNGTQPCLTSIERFQATYSSCGLCGATSLKALELKKPLCLTSHKQNSSASQTQFDVHLIYSLANKMRDKQSLFSLTGGIHCAALFDQNAQLLTVYEDIGRHNAVDKVIGHCLVKEVIPQEHQLLLMLVSGRVSFEIVQKAIMAGIKILVSVGAPSHLAIKAAQRFELTLVGFVSNTTFNVYHGDWRFKSS